MSPLSPEALLQHIEQVDEKHEQAHRRLRGDLDRCEAKVEQLEGSQVGNVVKFDEIAGKPVEFAKIRFTPGVVIVLLSTVLSVSGGVWASTYSLRSDVRDILTRMEEREKTEEATRKLQDERHAALERSFNTLGDQLDVIKRRQDLQQFEIQELKSVILKQAKR